MKKGIVMDILSEREAIVLTKDGQFLKAFPTKAGYKIGEEVIYSTTHQTFANRKKFSPPIRWIASIAAVFLVFFVGLPGYFGLNTGSQEVAAYISVDINPSIELGINTQNNVVTITALNDDGDQLISAIKDKILKKDLTVAMDILLNESTSRGYLKEDNKVIVSTTKVNNEVNIDQIEEEINEVIKKQEKVSKSIAVTMFETSTTFREEAMKNGVSSGKYAVYVTVKNTGQTISVDEIKRESISHWKEAIELIQKEKSDKNNLSKIIDQRLEKLDKKLPEKVEEKRQDKVQDKVNKTEDKTEKKSDFKENPSEKENKIKDKDNKREEKELKTDPSSEEKRIFLQIKKWSESFKKNLNKKTNNNNETKPSNSSYTKTNKTGKENSKNEGKSNLNKKGNEND